MRANETQSREPVADADLLAFLHDAGLLPTGSHPSLRPLTGGVASDIWMMHGPAGDCVVKRACARLRVAQEWTAPVSRNASEVLWFVEAARIVPQAVPRILAHDAERGAFAMAYFDPATHPVWKEELRHGRVDVAFAARVGTTIARIHSGTANSAALRSRFANDETFSKLRLEPYLEALETMHPGLVGPLSRLSADTMRTKIALVHGDVSPKNILVGPAGPILLDAECAWYGDPAFDLAFCLNHLLLKRFLAPAAFAMLLQSFDAMRGAYLSRVDWEATEDLDRRAARLLPALLLARVDGKSPVEYLDDEQKRLVRRVATPLVAHPPETLAAIAAIWEAEAAP